VPQALVPDGAPLRSLRQLGWPLTRQDVMHLQAHHLSQGAGQITQVRAGGRCLQLGEGVGVGGGGACGWPLMLAAEVCAAPAGGSLGPGLRQDAQGKTAPAKGGLHVVLLLQKRARGGTQ
jgi:hypothetical protein